MVILVSILVVSILGVVFFDTSAVFSVLTAVVLGLKFFTKTKWSSLLTILLMILIVFSGSVTFIDKFDRSFIRISDAMTSGSIDSIEEDIDSIESDYMQSDRTLFLRAEYARLTGDLGKGRSCIEDVIVRDAVYHSAKARVESIDPESRVYKVAVKEASDYFLSDTVHYLNAGRTCFMDQDLYNARYYLSKAFVTDYSRNKDVVMTLGYLSKLTGDANACNYFKARLLALPDLSDEERSLADQLEVFEGI